MSRPKDQGTRLESHVVTVARLCGLGARRLAEGGSKDEGDVEIATSDGRIIILECKARAALSLHDAWCKARHKAPDVADVGVVWKRLVRRDGRTRRVAAGPTLVALPLDDYLDLLAKERNDA